MFVDETSAVLSFSIVTTGLAVKNHMSPKRARELIVTHPIVSHFLVFGFSVLFSPISSSSSPQEYLFNFNRYTDNVVPKRSGSTSEEELQGNPLYRPTETEKRSIA